MKKLWFLCLCFMSFFCSDGFAAASGRSGMNRSITTISTPVYKQNNNTNVVNTQTQTQVAQKETEKESPEVTKKKKEREVCLANNIGIGNTFVWASRYSNTDSYANMVEDVTNPQNNVCFVRVELKSKDESRVSVSDIPAKYFMWGESIQCGVWGDKKDLEKRILEARKGARIGGIVASTVGGAGIGVGAMELFGNKLIGGKVEGQKSLSERELLRSQVLALQKTNKAQYDKIIRALEDLDDVCNDTVLWNGVNKPTDCDPERNLFIGLRDLL